MKDICKRMTESILVGAAIGSAIGGTLSILIKPKKKSKSSLCKGTHKVLETIGRLADNLSDIMG